MGLAYEENVADTRESPVSGIVERFFHKKSSKNCPPGGVTVFGCGAMARRVDKSLCTM